MKHIGFSPNEVEMLVIGNAPYDYDHRGRPRYVAVAKGVRLRIVLAVDRPNLVVTVHERRSG